MAKEAWHPISECETCRFRKALEEIEAKLLVPCSVMSHSERLKGEAWEIAAKALGILKATTNEQKH